MERVISRRQLLIVAAAGVLGAPLRALAQADVRRVGFLYFGSRQYALETGRYAAFVEGMRERGYTEGKDFVIEARFADGRAERLGAQAADLARAKVDVIVATGAQAAQATRRASAAIPVVLTTAGDPVADGYAASLGRPGGQYTGITSNNVGTILKGVELLALAVRPLSRIAVLFNPASNSHLRQLENIEMAVSRSRMNCLSVEAGTAEEIEAGFSRMARYLSEAAVILGDSFFVQQSAQIAALALRYRLPSLYPTSEYPEAGGLMSYGPDLVFNLRRAAYYVDRILRGAKAGELPFEPPARLYLVFNQKTAGAIGLAIPQELLRRADKVIE